jgi:hypothetical protein
MRRLLAILALGVPLLVGCGDHASATPESSCTPPPGGRCAGDVAWPGAIHVSSDGRRLTGIVSCGGTLTETETTDRVTIRLHVGAMGPGTMSCARVRVGVGLSAPLGDRTVVDAVSSRTVHVIHARA